MLALVIDDSRTVRIIIGQILREIGMEVLEAVNGLEALEQIKQNPDVELMLVDWNMPEMNGLELVQAVRRDTRFASLPLMMVTTETEMAQVIRALDAGAQEYVMKPFTKDIIEEKLRVLGLLQ
jgi:two-component system, chemotaxis family, chemotaxis protein CheY